MNAALKQRENEIKLDILHTLSRCQRALADIMENMAAHTEGNAELAKHLQQNIEVIEKYQRAVAEKMMGLRINRIKRGRPGPVWRGPLARDVRIS